MYVKSCLRETHLTLFNPTFLHQDATISECTLLYFSHWQPSPAGYTFYGDSRHFFKETFLLPKEEVGDLPWEGERVSVTNVKQQHIQKKKKEKRKKLVCTHRHADLYQSQDWLRNLSIFGFYCHIHTYIHKVITNHMLFVCTWINSTHLYAVASDYRCLLYNTAVW